MGWWIDPEEYEDVPDSKPDGKVNITYTQKYCDHKWKCTILIISNVYDCVKCGIKKEDFEKWQKVKK
jgi:hypothetical protein